MNKIGDNKPKKVIVEDMKDEKSFEFDSIVEASEYLKMDRSYIGKISKSGGIVAYRYKITRVEDSK